MHKGGDKKSTLAAIMVQEMRKKKEQEERDRQRREAAAAAAPPARVDPWVLEGIIVKVMSKALEGHGYYKKKGAVVGVRDR